MGVNSLPKTVTRQRRGCDLNQGPNHANHSATDEPPSMPGWGANVPVQSPVAAVSLEVVERR